MILLMLLNLLILYISILVGVAFLTLLERKILSYIHNRKGPNKVGMKGLLQPFSDALKLLSKEMLLLYVQQFMFYFSPMFMFLLSMLMWIFYPIKINYLNDHMLLFVFLLGLSVYPILMVGWFSNNNYSILGSLRSISQMISFEISLFMMLLCLMMFIESMSFDNFFWYQINMKFFLMIFPIYFMFMVSMLIELNRTPFDLVEGESELVSGFNTEYYGSSFVFIFLAEYSSILFMSMILTMMFFGYQFWSLKFLIFFMFHLLLILWIRGVLPRIRYDELMFMCWIDFLVIVMIYLVNIFLFKELCNILS